MSESTRYQIESSFWVPADIDQVWEFASKPKNLAKISPPEMNIHVSHEGPSYEGLEFEIRLKPPLLPINITWGSRIENVIPSGDERSFEDVQTYGPFKYWKHTHSFAKGTRDVESPGSGTVRSLTPGTWIKDVVVYEMPLGALGTVAHKLVVDKILRNVFRDRKEAVLKILDTLQ